MFEDIRAEDSSSNIPNDKQNNKLNELVNLLPEKRKEIFLSVVVHGKSYAEIAETNGISVNTVKTQMKRAYAFLRSYRKEDYITVFLLLHLFSYLFQ